MAAIVLEEHPGTTVVTDSVTSFGLKQWIESLGESIIDLSGAIEM